VLVHKTCTKNVLDDAVFLFSNHEQNSRIKFWTGPMIANDSKNHLPLHWIQNILII